MVLLAVSELLQGSCYEHQEWRAIRFGRDGPKVLLQPKLGANAGRVVPYTELDYAKGSEQG